MDLQDEIGTPLFLLESNAADIRSLIDGCIGRRVILVPLIDQTLKFLVLHRLGRESISLGLVGKVTSVQTRIWIVRAPYRCQLAII